MLTSFVRTIQFYRTDTGKCPVELFLDSLSDKQAQKVTWVMRLIERLDHIPQRYLKKLTGTKDLWEIRTQFGGEDFRFLGFFNGPTLLILTSGFSKKRQKIPLREIELAQKRRDDYIRRKIEP